MKITPTTPAQQLAEELRTALPEALLTVDPPADQTGEWWFDISIRGHNIEVSWSEVRGFGLFLPDTSYGDRPSEVYRTVELLARRLTVLDQAIALGTSLALSTPGQVRALRGVNQRDVADCLHISQPSVSKLESRNDVLLSSLSSYLEALDARIELRIVARDFSAPLDFSSCIKTAWTDLPAVYSRMSSPAVTLVVLRVLEIELVRSFYETVGIRLKSHRHGNGPEHYASENNGRVFELYPAKSVDDVTNNVRVGFAVPSLDTALEHLDRACIARAPHVSEFGRVATVIDPAGTKVDLYEGSYA